MEALSASKLSMRGLNGRITWGYYDAGHLPAWEFVGAAERGTITGRVVQMDTYRLSQRPLVFAVTRPKTVWRWPILELQQHGDSVVLTVGPCLE
jgi:hypothetical protein